MKSLRSDLAVLYHLALRPIRGRDHAQRMEDFYRGQADHYDQFRKRLLPERRELFQSIQAPDLGVWVDLGGGTGANFEELGDRIHGLGKAYVVDLAPSLLAIARRRAEDHGWRNVETVCADATSFRPPEGKADVVTFSYSLTMIPDWFAAVDNAEAMLKPGGILGVVDFYVSRPFPTNGMARHSTITRFFWPMWFGLDGVVLSADHLPYLRRRFETILLKEGRSKVPYLPWGRVPFYTFVGRKPASSPGPLG